MSTWDGNPLSLPSLMKGLKLGMHCPSCAEDLATLSSILKSEQRKTRSSSILINIDCCALDSLTLLDVQSLLVRPRYRTPVCGICSPVSLRMREHAMSLTMESLILQGSSTLAVKPPSDSTLCSLRTQLTNVREPMA